MTGGLHSTCEVDGEDPLMQLFGFSGTDLGGFNDSSWFADDNAMDIADPGIEVGPKTSAMDSSPNASHVSSSAANRSSSSQGSNQLQGGKHSSVETDPEAKAAWSKVAAGPSKSEKRKLEDHARFMYRRVDQLPPGHLQTLTALAKRSPGNKPEGISLALWTNIVDSVDHRSSPP